MRLGLTAIDIKESSRHGLVCMCEPRQRTTSTFETYEDSQNSIVSIHTCMAVNLPTYI